MLRDTQLSTAPETIHLAAEVGSELRRADHEQDLVVLMGSTWAPVEAAGDHGLAIDHSELVWLGTQKCPPACFLSVSVGRSAA